MAFSQTVTLSIAQGIVWAVGLDLVDDLVGLDGQVLGERAGFLVGENEIQVFGFEQRAMGIMACCGVEPQSGG